MKTRFCLLALCLTIAMASYAPVNAAEDAADSVKQTVTTTDDDVIPEVPEKGSLKDYKEYVDKLNCALNEKAKDMIVQAQKDGVAPQSEEFAKSLKTMANQYFARIMQATDKALLLKDITNEEFEELVGAKIQIMVVLAQLNGEEEDALNAKMEEFIAQLRKMDKSKIADDLEAQLIQSKIINYAEKDNVNEFSKIAADIDVKVEKAGKNMTPALAQQAILILLAGVELTDYNVPEGRQDKYIKAISEASDPEISKLAENLEMKLLQNKIMSYARRGKVDEFAKVADEIDKRIEKAGKELTPDLAELAVGIVLVSAKLKDYKAPEGRVDKYTQAFTEASDPEVKKLADVLKTVLQQIKNEE